MSLPVRKGAPCLSDKEAGGGPETVKDRVKKFVCVLEEEIKTQYKQENILSYLSVFGPGKKTLPLLSPVNSLDVGENGHRYEQLLSSASKRKFFDGMVNGQQLARMKFLAGNYEIGQGKVQGPSKKSRM